MKNSYNRNCEYSYFEKLKETVGVVLKRPEITDKP